MSDLYINCIDDELEKSNLILFPLTCYQYIDTLREVVIIETRASNDMNSAYLRILEAEFLKKARLPVLILSPTGESIATSQQSLREHYSVSTLRMLLWFIIRNGFHFRLLYRSFSNRRVWLHQDYNSRGRADGTCLFDRHWKLTFLGVITPWGNETVTAADKELHGNWYQRSCGVSWTKNGWICWTCPCAGADFLAPCTMRVEADNRL